MSLPVSVTLFDPGANGAPTSSNPFPLPDLDDVECSSTNEGGFEALRVSFRVSSPQAAVDYLNRLMSSVVASGPRGQIVWEGFLNEVELDLGTKKVSVALTDMANRIRVRYKAVDGQQTSTSTVSNTSSISRYGTKERLINFGATAPTAAANRASVVLGQTAHPRAKQSASAGSGSPRNAGVGVTLICRGWWDTLSWLLTSNTSTSSVATATQVISLIAAFNAINAFFSSSTATISATGVSDTELIEGDSTYAEVIATKLASGTSALQRVVYGCYENRQISVRTWAGATPDTITYVQSASDHTVRDVFGNVIDPWDVRPDAMVQLTDLVLPNAASGPIDTATRFYARRVTCRLSRTEQTVTFDSDNSDSLEELLTRPAGSGPAGSSARQAAIERTVVRQLQPHFSPTNGHVDLDGGQIATNGGSIITGSGGIDLGPSGSIATSGGSINTAGGSINTGGGSITNTGGGAIDLGTGAGIGGVGSSGVTTSGGTTGALAKWTGPNALGNAVAGTDYAAASHTHAAGDITSGLMATARLGSGSASATTFLAGDQTWKTITPATIGAVDGSGAAGRLAYWSDTNTLTSSSILTFDGATLTTGAILTTGASSGVVFDERDGSGQWVLYANSSLFRFYDGAGDVVSIDTNGLITSVSDSIVLGAYTLNMDGSLRVSGASASSGDALIYNGTAFVPTALTIYAPIDAKYIVQTSNGTLTNEQALGSLATGLLKNTTSTGVLTIAVAGTDYAAASHTHTASDITNFAEAVDDRVGSLLSAGTNITLTYNDAGNILTIDADVGAPANATYITQTSNGTLTNEQVLGSLATGMVRVTTTTGVLSSVTGTSGRLVEWSTASLIGASTLAKTGSGVVTVACASGSHTLTVTTSGELDMNNFLFRLSSSSRLDGNDKTITWSEDLEFGSITASGDAVSNGYWSVSHNGVSYKVMLRA